LVESIPLHARPRFVARITAPILTWTRGDAQSRITDFLIVTNTAHRFQTRNTSGPQLFSCSSPSVRHWDYHWKHYLGHPPKAQGFPARNISTTVVTDHGPSAEVRNQQLHMSLFWDVTGAPVLTLGRNRYGLPRQTTLFVANNSHRFPLAPRMALAYVLLSRTQRRHN